MEKILIVEDNTGMRNMLSNILKEQGYTVKDAPDVSSALLLLKKEFFSVIISDLQMPEIDGLSFLKKIKKHGIPFIMLTGYGSINKAVEVMKEGAFDFITKPVDPEYLYLIVKKAINSTQIVRENLIFKEVHTSMIEKSAIIGNSRTILKEAEKTKQVAITDTPVLLLGESGTGKELFARAIHRLSERRNKPFITVNAASIPDNLLENELFGHEKGSYTDAFVQHIGKLELAQGGTFFLDEIGDMPIRLQGKILRVIEEKTISRLGSSQEISLDIRFIFATNKNLETAVSEGLFRNDLYFRISVFPITLPPLRERGEDIKLLTEFFLKKFSLEIRGHKSLSISEEAVIKLMKYSWPGNVRELSNTIERGVILCKSDKLEINDIILPTSQKNIDEEFYSIGDAPLKIMVETLVKKFEKFKIRETLSNSKNKVETAKILDISYKTLLKKIKEYEL